jgi:short-subunit dehydrogenase
VRVWPTDLSDLSAAEAVAAQAQDEFEGIDVLVNNAGMPMRRRVTELTADDVERTMALNYMSPVRMTLVVLGAMVERGRGSIVNVASVGGRFPILGEAAYCASKAALCAFTETLAVDLHGTGVDARLILPGPIDTEIWDQPDQDAAFYDGPLEAPELVADGIVAAIEGDRIEHWLPDLSAVNEMKVADLDGFVASMVGAVGEQE